MEFTKTQIERLRALGDNADFDESFADGKDRDAAFRKAEKALIRQNRRKLNEMREDGSPVLINDLAERMSRFLRERGFIEVSTPIVISKQYLERMTIDDTHSLHKQVFWTDEKTCLRPMLAPTLYDISKNLLNIFGTPLGVFEIGPCFRKESQGASHLECFTMLDFVEWGIDESEKEARAQALISELMVYLGFEDYAIVAEESVVYGETFDVVVDGKELASGAYGPHPLDAAWGIDTTWLGLGMGLERAVCMLEDIPSVQRVGRSLTYHNGVCLNFK